MATGVLVPKSDSSIALNFSSFSVLLESPGDTVVVAALRLDSVRAQDIPHLPDTLVNLSRTAAGADPSDLNETAMPVGKEVA